MGRDMGAKLTVLGVHPIAAGEPCHLIEILLAGSDEDLDFGKVTQEVDGQPRSNWQVPYDEQMLEESEGEVRYAFFFHYLDFAKPLLTPLGSVQLPKPTKLPTHLKGIKYEAP